MKKTLLATLLIAGFVTASNAATFSTAPYGDAILAFRNASAVNPGKYTDVLIDLGVINRSTLDFTVNLGAGPVSDAYTGATPWYSRPSGEILWGVIGSDYTSVSSVFDPNVDNGDGTFGDYVVSLDHAGVGNVIASSPYAANSSWALNSASVFNLSTKVGQLAGGDGSLSSVLNSGGKSLQTLTLVGDGSSADTLFTSYEGGKVLSGDVWASSGVTIGNSTLSRYLYNYDVDGKATLLGSFSLNAVNGSFSYMAIPEPSTYALMGLGALLFIIVLRRKTA
jgi:hypothetical protein